MRVFVVNVHMWQLSWQPKGSGVSHGVPFPCGEFKSNSPVPHGKSPILKPLFI